MKKDKRLESKRRLLHIVEALELVRLHVQDVDETKFCNHALINNAVLFQCTIIGEAILHVEQEILDKHSYPWHRVRAFRNLIAHEYFNVKMEAVWRIVQHEFPQLKDLILHVLEQEF
jgi:uncharacterized protein with HEPN domain